MEKDVSSLPDVVNCIQADRLQLKKFLYLCLMNYAKRQPDMAIMAAHSFVKDCEDLNPLFQSLVVRTIGCIPWTRLQNISMNCSTSSGRMKIPMFGKQHQSARQNSAILMPTWVKDEGFLDALQDLLADSNPMVVATAVQRYLKSVNLTQTATYSIRTHRTLISC